MNWVTKMTLVASVAVTLAVLVSVAANGAELKPETARDWDEYLLHANAGMIDRMQRSFLWVDENGQQLQRVRAGQIAVAPIQHKMPIAIQHGLVHHWIGAAFTPGIHIDEVIATVREYDRYAEIYTPSVIGAQVIERSADPEHSPDHFVLTFVNKNFFSKHALECESTSTYTRVDARRWYAQSRTVRVQEWAQYGTAHQRMLPQGEGAGFVWNAFTMTRFLERDGGVYVEMEVVTLSRDVPVTMREVVNPIIRRVSRSTLLTSLDETRKAAEGRAPTATTASKAGQ